MHKIDHGSSPISDEATTFASEAASLTKAKKSLFSFRLDTTRSHIVFISRFYFIPYRFSDDLTAKNARKLCILNMLQMDIDFDSRNGCANSVFIRILCGVESQRANAER